MASAATALTARPDLATTLNKALAIFWRDAQLAWSYEMTFFTQIIGFAVSVVTTYLIASLVAPSPKFGFGGHTVSYFEFLIINLTFVSFQSASLQSFARVIRDGQMQGTLEVVLSTPTSLSLIVLSGGLWAFAFTLLETGINFVIAIFFGLDLRHTNILTAFTFLALTIASLSPLGVISAAVTMVFKQTGPVDFVIGSLSYVFGGVFLPLASLPPALQYIGWTLPITHALNGLRASVQGATLAQLLPDAIWLCVATLIFLPLSLYIFERAVHRAKIDGTLGQY
jgi:ABC-type multidrug transport system permease subunit